MSWPWSRRTKSTVIEFQVRRSDGLPTFALPVSFPGNVGSSGCMQVIVDGAPDVVVDFEVKDGWT